MPTSSIKITFPNGTLRQPATDDGRSVVFYDIDNCLYSKDAGVDGLMRDKIEQYFEKLGLPIDEAKQLRYRYYTEYGLAIRGLVRHHQVDPLDYDRQCDAALPLETVLKPSNEMKQLLKDIDRTKFRVWALTNAYYNHATRVLKLLELEEYFEGVVSCDYGAKEFSCKPEEPYFNQAVEACGQFDVSKLYFVDDSALNIRGANSLGWGHCVLFDEHGDQKQKLYGIDEPDESETQIHRIGSSESEQDDRRRGQVSVIGSMQELRRVWQEMFQSQSNGINGHYSQL
ncbi:putative suppressor of disruption of TFIIS [Microbotryomycetes sp. JL221]|nr:putative suppressor of disruption of TFIIS [Microbotryomycetes sp. JL221]